MSYKQWAVFEAGTVMLIPDKEEARTRALRLYEKTGKRFLVLEVIEVAECEPEQEPDVA